MYRINGELTSRVLVPQRTLFDVAHRTLFSTVKKREKRLILIMKGADNIGQTKGESKKKTKLQNDLLYY